jgi:hypothetical protein
MQVKLLFESLTATSYLSGTIPATPTKSTRLQIRWGRVFLLAGSVPYAQWRPSVADGTFRKRVAIAEGH